MESRQELTRNRVAVGVVLAIVGFAAAVAFGYLIGQTQAVPLAEAEQASAVLTAPPLDETATTLAPTTTVSTTTAPTPPPGPDVSEFSPSERQVHRLYIGVLGRPSDSQGRVFWAEEIDAGTPAEDVVNALISSDEFDPDISDSELIELLYRNLLARPSDSAGRDFWQSRLDDGLSAQELIVEFANSSEAREATGT